MELCGCKLDGWMDALLTITVFFLSSVIWNEWKVVVVESQAKHVKVVGVVVVDMVGERWRCCGGR